ncbi:formylmethanofuran dehydrogenase subunit E [Methanomicrobium sp. W14]|uniref:formylmethanofuran dehydrogenase subunit E family protein n=1 Tax=Methanomicrobium sp. W14 TaxID=2817839 RepID=UPI001AEA8240|nr:formylmethanofuran dehydrogenase subunit E family protein [Methanomicrobium sp. W14]MBP2134376.1 formylmethanofuran dehydrogenase subunit E [Methanomicrobium sp. W14]
MKWHPHCKYMELPKDYSVEDLARFHGHLGPNIVLGYMMGKYASDNLCCDPFSLKAKVFCPKKTPESCIVDGVQLGSGCTLGKGNIEIVEQSEIECEFIANSKILWIKPKNMPPLPENDGDYEVKIEKYAEELYRMNPDFLFEIKRDE